MSKGFKGKDCVYCGAICASDAPDHVIAREFFFVKDRGNLPKVPSCKKCNNEKSKLEHIITATLLAASNIENAAEYRQQFVAPRLENNHKLIRESGLTDPPVWRNKNNIIQPMNVLKIDADKLFELIALIVKGLYFYHFKSILPPEFKPTTHLLTPSEANSFRQTLGNIFAAGYQSVDNNFGNGTFNYVGTRSSKIQGFSVWVISIHGGIALHGRGSPPEGIDYFWCVTSPTDEYATQIKEQKKLAGLDQLH